MSNAWKRDILNAIIMLLSVAVVAIVINSIRDPVLAMAARRGLISPGTEDRVRALRLIDNWSHEGKVGFRDLPAEPNGTDDGQNGVENGGTQVEPVIYRIDVENAKRLFDEGECAFLDARTPEEYSQNGHIPGAINWPAESYDEYRRVLIDTLGKDQCLVVYCSEPSCNDSSFLSSSLRNEGFTEIYWFEGGMEDWLPMGYPVVFGSEP
jgi:rhodanese-related sulfurtransferase